MFVLWSGYLFVYDSVCLCMCVSMCMFRRTVRRQSVLSLSQRWSWLSRSLCWITSSSGAFLMSQSFHNALTLWSASSQTKLNHLYRYCLLWDQLITTLSLLDWTRRKTDGILTLLLQRLEFYLTQNFHWPIKSLCGKLLLWWRFLPQVGFFKHLQLNFRFFAPII